MKNNNNNTYMTCSFIEILLSERDEKVISHYCVALFIKVKSLIGVQTRQHRRNASREPGLFNHEYD